MALICSASSGVILWNVAKLNLMAPICSLAKYVTASVNVVKNDSGTSRCVNSGPKLSIEPEQVKKL